MTGREQPSRKKRHLAAYIPLAIFGALAAIFLVMLLSGRDASVIPSALLGAPAPETVLPPLDPAARGLDPAELTGSVTLVNVWASWCAPCRQEHPVLMALARDGRIRIAGFNYKDNPDRARGFLTELGNPYDVIGVDPDGRAAIEWGVYGVPETFLLGRDGTIRYKHVGALTPQILERALMPEIERALAERPETS